MSRPIIAALALVTSASMAVPARAADGDSVFGSFFSRVTGTRQATADTPRAQRAAEAEMRDREARELRRNYWERERARIAEQAAARQAVVASTTR
jgi:hypothetical protein